MIFSIYLFARQLKTFKMQILIKLALYLTISCTSNDLFIVQCDDENIVGHVVTQACLLYLYAFYVYSYLEVDY